MPSSEADADVIPARVTRTLDALRYGGGKFENMSLQWQADRYKPVIDIQFQSGPLPTGVNGCSIEDVIDLLVERLEGFQRGALTSHENFEAIKHLTVAKFWLLERTNKRQKQGVEGSNRPHVS